MGTKGKRGAAGSRGRHRLDETPDRPRNEVVLVGRVAAPAQERVLPSGDVVSTWRLVVARPTVDEPEVPRRPLVDTVDCAAWSSAAVGAAATLASGDVVRVEGALRRRFWRAGGAAASRYEVEVALVERVRPVAP